MMYVVFSVIFLGLLDIAKSSQWDYIDESHWPGVCRTGQQQSPINIVRSQTVVDMKGEHIMGPLVYRGYGAVDVAAVNNGHTLQWDALPGSVPPTLSGGPLNGNYTFVQLHLHWLSEHAIDGIKYPLEIHIVHIKTGLSLTEAVSRPDGLAVIGILANVHYGPTSEEAFEQLIEVVPQLVQPTPGVPNQAEVVDLTRLFTSDPQSYFTYHGSLTTPDCQESVTWIVMDEPIVVSDSQYKILTKVDIGGVNNFRSLQPSNRPVYHSTASCSSIVTPSLALLGTVLHCTVNTLGTFVKRGLCFVANFKKRVWGLKSIEC